MNREPECPIFESHLSWYLHNNQAPTEEDEKKVLTWRASLNAEILSQQTLTAGTPNGMDNSDYLDALRRSLSRCQTILSPFRCLPKEVLGEIFVRCLSTLRYPTLNYKEAPLLLTHVCASWKAIANSTPALWTRIHIHLSQKLVNPLLPLSSAFDPQTGHLERTSTLPGHLQITQWLRQSGSLPLKIDLSAPYAVRSKEEYMLLESIFSRSKQVQSLNLDLHMVVDGNFGFHLHAEGFPWLETLSIRSANDDELSDPTSIFHSPNLRDLIIDAVPYQNFMVPTTWSRLRSLVIYQPIDGFAARKLLTHCECLVDCVLKIALDIAKEPTDLDDIPIIFHPRLENFTFIDPGKGVLTPDTLFQSLHPPNLRYLKWSVEIIRSFAPRGHHLLGHGFSSTNPTSEPIIQRNFLSKLDKLKTLAMSGNDQFTLASFDSILRFLQHVPSSVTTLILGNKAYSLVLPHRDFDAMALNMLSTRNLTTSTDSACGLLLPNLENVEYYPSVRSSIAMPQALLGTLILARTMATDLDDPFPRRLKHVVAHIYIEDVEEDKLQHLLSDNLRARIQSSNIPFNLEVYCREDKDNNKLMLKFDFDPSNHNISV